MVKEKKTIPTFSKISPKVTGHRFLCKILEMINHQVDIIQTGNIQNEILQH